MPLHPLDKPCRRCGSRNWERLPRTSFFLATVLDFFDRYPWRCALCNDVRYLQLRADTRPITRPGMRTDIGTDKHSAAPQKDRDTR